MPQESIHDLLAPSLAAGARTRLEAIYMWDSMWGNIWISYIYIYIFTDIVISHIWDMIYPSNVYKWLQMFVYTDIYIYILYTYVMNHLLTSRNEYDGSKKGSHHRSPSLFIMDAGDVGLCGLGWVDLSSFTVQGTELKMHLVWPGLYSCKTNQLGRIAIRGPSRASSPRCVGGEEHLKKWFLFLAT